MQRGMRDVTITAGDESVLIEQVRGTHDDSVFGSVELTPEQIDGVCQMLQEAKAEVLANRAQGAEVAD